MSGCPLRVEGVVVEVIAVTPRDEEIIIISDLYEGTIRPMIVPPHPMFFVPAEKSCINLFVYIFNVTVGEPHRFQRDVCSYVRIRPLCACERVSV